MLYGWTALSGNAVKKSRKASVSKETLLDLVRDIVSSRGHGPWTSGERVQALGSEKALASRISVLEARPKVNLISKET